MTAPVLDLVLAPEGKATAALTAMEDAFGRLYDVLMLVACLLILLMVGAITADVLLRNLEIPGLPRGLPVSNDISEYALYLCALLAAPRLLRSGQHIRVDIVLRALPPTLAWLCEWVSDLVGLAGCATVAWIGTLVAARSHASGAIQIKSIAIPEWWVMVPLPVAFALLAGEFAFRMRRLARGRKVPRSDAVTTA